MAKILVVDDEVNIRRMIRKFAEFEGYEVFEAFDKAMHELYRNVLSIQPQDLYIKYEVIYGWGEPAKIFKI